MAKNRQVLIKFEGDSRGLVSASKLSQKELNEIQRSAKDASAQLTGMGGRLASVAKGVAVLGAAAAAAAAVGLAAQVKQTIDLADNYAKMSQKVNVSVESLSTLDYVASLNGTTLNALSKALLRVSTGLLDADRGLKESVENFEALGIETKNAEGRLKSADEVLIEVADSFADMEDGSQKTALAMKLFGKSGAELIPMLNLGSAGIRELQEEARKLGIEIGTETAKQAEIFNDNLDTMRQMARSVGVEITTALLPKLAELTTLFKMKRLDGAGLIESFLFALQGRDGQIKQLEQKIDEENKKIAAIYEKLQNPTMFGGLIKRNISYKDEQENLRNAEAAKATAAAEIRRIEEQENQENLNRALDSEIKPYQQEQIALEQKKREAIEATQKAREKEQAAVEKARESLISINQTMLQEINTVGKSREEVLKYRLTYGDLTDEMEKAGQASGKLAEEIIATARAADEADKIREQSVERLAEKAAAELRAADIVKGLRTEEEKLADALREIQLLVDMGFLTQDMGNTAMQRMADDFDKLNKKAAESEDQFKELTNAVNGWGRDFANSVVEADFTFEGFANNIIKQLAKIALQQATQPFFNAFGNLLGAGVGSLFSGFGGAAAGGAANVAQNGASFISGARAEGGPVSAGRTYLVGERGPELFRPSINGGIIPNGGMTGGGQPIQISIAVDANGSAVSGNEPKGNQLGKLMGNAVRDVLIQEKRPGGLLS